jgi:hypothetical protein
MAEAVPSSWLLETIVTFLRSPMYKVVVYFSALADINRRSCTWLTYITIGPNDGIY